MGMVSVGVVSWAPASRVLGCMAVSAMVGIAGKQKSQEIIGSAHRNRKSGGHVAKHATEDILGGTLP